MRSASDLRHAWSGHSEGTARLSGPSGAALTGHWLGSAAREELRS